MKIKLLGGALAVAVFAVAASPVGAQSVSDLQLQIQALMAQVAALQGRINNQGSQPAGPVNPVIPRIATPAWCYDFHTNLRFGDGGGGATEKESYVRNLQVALEREGFYVDDSEQKAGSVFEESTAAAVVGFQEKYRNEILDPAGLSRGTGYVGQSTRAKLNRLYGCGIIKPVPPPIAEFEVTHPISGAVFNPGERMTVRWTSSGPHGPYSLILLNNGKQVLREDTLKAGCGAGSCSYQWTAPRPTWSRSEKSTEQIVITDGNGRSAYSGFFNISNATSEIPVDLVTTARYSNGNQNALITASIRGSSQNRKVSYWTLDLSCSRGVIVEGKGGSSDMCGSHWNIYSSEIFDVTKDYFFITAGAANNGGSDNPGVVFALVAYDANGAKIGSDKEEIRLGSVNAKPSVRVVSPNGGELWNAGQAHNIRWSMPTDQRYWTNWYLVPQGSTPRKQSGSGSFLDPEAGGYAIGGQSATYPVANASTYVIIPGDIPAGTYKLRAYLSRYESSGQVPDPSDALAWDESDSNFTIGGGSGGRSDQVDVDP